MSVQKVLPILLIAVVTADCLSRHEKERNRAETAEKYWRESFNRGSNRYIDRVRKTLGPPFPVEETVPHLDEDLQKSLKMVQQNRYYAITEEVLQNPDIANDRMSSGFGDISVKEFLKRYRDENAEWAVRTLEKDIRAKAEKQEKDLLQKIKGQLKGRLEGHVMPDDLEDDLEEKELPLLQIFLEEIITNLIEMSEMGKPKDQEVKNSRVKRLAMANFEDTTLQGIDLYLGLLQRLVTHSILMALALPILIPIIFLGF